MRVPAYFGTQGILCHNASPHNAEGVYLNQYTLIFDVYVDGATFSGGSGWLPFHNTNATNDNDADAYIQYGFGLGIGGDYAGTFNADTWHRVAMTFDLADPAGPRFTKFIDGSFVGWQILDEGIDGRWSMYCTDDPDADVEDIFYLFTEPEGLYTSQVYVNSIFFADYLVDGKVIGELGAPRRRRDHGAAHDLRLRLERRRRRQLPGLLRLPHHVLQRRRRLQRGRPDQLPGLLRLPDLLLHAPEGLLSSARRISHTEALRSRRRTL